MKRREKTEIEEQACDRGRRVLKLYPAGNLAECAADALADLMHLSGGKLNLMIAANRAQVNYEAEAGK